MNKITITVVIVAALALGMYFLIAPKTHAPEGNTQENMIEEHADQKPDLGLIVSESIVGTWQSNEDRNFVREFKSGGISSDLYEGKVTSHDTWKAFTAEKPVATAFPLEANTPYIQILSDQNEAYTFKVNKLTPETLELVYLDRGGMLTFTRIK